VQSLLAPGFRAKIGRSLAFTALLVCLAFVLAYQTGLFTPSGGPKPDASGVASFTVSPPR
jgi:hypothetical protein